jgi:hypothetical protein
VIGHLARKREYKGGASAVRLPLGPTVSLHGPLHVAFLISLRDGLAFIVLALAARQGHLHLGQPPVIEINPQGNKGEAPLIQFGPNLGDFGSVKQKFSLARGFVVVYAGLFVLGDFGPDQPAFTALDLGIGAIQIDMGGAQGFDLTAGQGQTCFILVHDLEVAVGLLIDRLCLLVFVFLGTCHASILVDAALFFKG